MLFPQAEAAAPSQDVDYDGEGDQSNSPVMTIEFVRHRRAAAAA